MISLDLGITNAARGRFALLSLLVAASALLAACGGDSSSPAPTALSCDNSMKTAFVPDANTQVLLVKSFKKGDSLALSGTPASPTPPVAANDLCFVKLNVGPGNPGPASAPSTSPGIGIEIWLPTAANWNQKIHNLGGGGWAGGNQGSTTLIGNAGAAATAGAEGSVVGSTDTGHSIGNGSFAMNPDGTPNTRSLAGLRGAQPARTRVEDQGVDAGVLPAGAEVRLLGRLLDRRSAGLQDHPEPSRRLQRLSRRCAGVQLDQVHHHRALSADRLPARPRRRRPDRGAAGAGERQGGERLRRRRRAAPRLHPQSGPVHVRPDARCHCALQRGRRQRRRRRHEFGGRMRDAGAGAGDEQDLVRADRRRLGARSANRQRIHPHIGQRPALVRPVAGSDAHGARRARRRSRSRRTWSRSSCRTRRSRRRRS